MPAMGADLDTLLALAEARGFTDADLCGFLALIKTRQVIDALVHEFAGGAWTAVYGGLRDANGQPLPEALLRSSSYLFRVKPVKAALDSAGTLS